MRKSDERTMETWDASPALSARPGAADGSPCNCTEISPKRICDHGTPVKAVWSGHMNVKICAIMHFCPGPLFFVLTEVCVTKCTLFYLCFAMCLLRFGLYLPIISLLLSEWQGCWAFSSSSTQRIPKGILAVERTLQQHMKGFRLFFLGSTCNCRSNSSKCCSWAPLICSHMIRATETWQKLHRRYGAALTSVPSRSARSSTNTARQQLIYARPSDEIQAPRATMEGLL